MLYTTGSPWSSLIGPLSGNPGGVEVRLGRRHVRQKIASVRFLVLAVRLVLTPGQASDKTTLPTLIDGLRPARHAVADRGYSARAIIELFATLGTTAHIPSQSNVKVIRTVDLALYRQRNLIERFFNKLKHLRRIATRYDKLARNFLAAIALASVRLRIRHYESTT